MLTTCVCARAAHEELPENGARGVLTELRRKHGRSKLEKELIRAAKLGLSRVPNNERRGLLELEVVNQLRGLDHPERIGLSHHKTLQQAVLIKLDISDKEEATSVAQRLLSIVRGLSGIDVRQQLQGLKAVSVRELVSTVLSELGRLSQNDREVKRVLSEMTKITLDADSVDKLKESPVRWLKLMQQLEQLWDRSTGEVHITDKNGPMGLLKKLLHPNMVAPSQRRGPRRVAEVDGSDDEESGNDPLSILRKACTKERAGARKVDEKASGLLFQQRQLVGTECPICLEDREEDLGRGAWAVTECSHSGHRSCLLEWVANQGCCPMCRKPLTPEQIYDIDRQPRPMQEVEEEFKVAYEKTIEEHGTKIARLLLEVKHAAERSPDGKVIVFSAWSRLLSLVEAALSDHRSFTVASLAGSKDGKDQALADFRKPISEGGVRVLCIVLGSGASGGAGGGAAGLTLIEAHTAILLEPQMNEGLEKQAAGRISRIGQKHETRFIRLIADCTVEPDIITWQKRRLEEVNSSSSSSGTEAESLNAALRLTLNASLLEGAEHGADERHPTATRLSQHPVIEQSELPARLSRGAPQPKRARRSDSPVGTQVVLPARRTRQSRDVGAGSSTDHQWL